MHSSGWVHHPLPRLTALIIVQSLSEPNYGTSLLSSSAHYEPGSECVEVLLLLLGTIIREKHRP